MLAKEASNWAQMQSRKSMQVKVDKLQRSGILKFLAILRRDIGIINSRLKIIYRL